MKVFVVVCNYNGCEDCGNGGGHVVGVFSTHDRAKEEERAHEADRHAHYGHYHWCDVQEFEVDVLPKTIEERGREEART